MAPGRLHWPAGSLAGGDMLVDLTPEVAGWSHIGLRVVRLAPGGHVDIATGYEEMAVLPLAGGVEVHVEGRLLRLAGRDNVFARVTDWAYVPVDAEVRNWSSYPPHRHDGSPECPVNNEEIYYFRIGRGGHGPSPDGFALHRTYTPDGSIDVNVVVRDGDVFCVPRGYHGPCIAAPGYPLYYLNALAGPEDNRSMAFCDGPAHHWVREAWEQTATGSRCPMTDALGTVGR